LETAAIKLFYLRRSLCNKKILPKQDLLTIENRIDEIRKQRTERMNGGDSDRQYARE